MPPNRSRSQRCWVSPELLEALQLIDPEMHQRIASRMLEAGVLRRAAPERVAPAAAAAAAVAPAAAGAAAAAAPAAPAVVVPQYSLEVRPEHAGYAWYCASALMLVHACMRATSQACVGVRLTHTTTLSAGC